MTGAESGLLANMKRTLAEDVKAVSSDVSGVLNTHHQGDAHDDPESLRETGMAVVTILERSLRESETVKILREEKERLRRRVLGGQEGTSPPDRDSKKGPRE